MSPLNRLNGGPCGEPRSYCTEDTFEASRVVECARSSVSWSRSTQRGWWPVARAKVVVGGAPSQGAPRGGEWWVGRPVQSSGPDLAARRADPKGAASLLLLRGLCILFFGSLGYEQNEGLIKGTATHQYGSAPNRVSVVRYPDLLTGGGRHPYIQTFRINNTFMKYIRTYSTQLSRRESVYVIKEPYVQTKTR